MSKVKAASVDKGKGKGRGDAEDEEGPGAFFNHLSLLQKCEEAMVAVQDMFGNADKRGEDELSAVFYEVQWGDRFDPERPRVPHHAKAARCKKLMKMVNEFTDETGATLARLFFKVTTDEDFDDAHERVPSAFAAFEDINKGAQMQGRDDDKEGSNKSSSQGDKDEAEDEDDDDVIEIISSRKKVPRGRKPLSIPIHRSDDEESEDESEVESPKKIKKEAKGSSGSKLAAASGPLTQWNHPYSPRLQSSGHAQPGFGEASGSGTNRTPTRQPSGAAVNQPQTRPTDSGSKVESGRVEKPKRKPRNNKKA